MNARLSYAPRRFDASRVSVELGHEPAIELAGARNEARERRRIPLRWLVGVALTGLTSAALIGSTLYLDLDRKSMFAEEPEFATPLLHQETPEPQGANLIMGDRLVRPIDVVADKQTFTSPMTIKVGDKELLKARPFTLLSTTLTTIPTAYADSVPTFDPLKLNNSGGGRQDVTQDQEPPSDDAEAGFTSRDIAEREAAEVKGELTSSEAQAQINDWVKRQNAGEKLPALAPQMLLMHTSHPIIDPLGALSYATTGSVESNTPFSSVEVHMVPENVTSVPRAPQDLRGDFGQERLAKLRHGETFEELLRGNGVSHETASAIITAFGVKPGGSPAAEGQKIILEYDSVDGSEKARRIACVSVYADEQLKAKVAVDDRGQYAPVAIDSAATGPQRAKPAAEAYNEGGMNLYAALYETALKQGMPRPIVDELIKAFLNDVDFQRSVQPGDSLVTFTADPDEFESRPTLLYAALAVRDQTFRYYRFETPDDSIVDYYDENGRSSRKFLLRKPVAAGEMSSPFGMRYHPILHYARLHSGVDWVAPVGTPIVAAGNGTILKAEYDSGYGRRVEIQHANGYVTTYNHMSAFARGIVPGAHVNQGQIVGYLGGSGLVTGPHLHYEVIINGNFVDPMAIKLARTREFDGKMLASFKKERDRIDQLMAQAPNASAAAPSASVAARIN